MKDLLTFQEELEIFKKDNPAYDDDAIQRFRNEEFPALGIRNNEAGETVPGNAYLDYTGGNLTPLSLLDAHHQFLKDNILGNPHSHNPTSNFATEMIEQARKEVLKYFNAEEHYCCVFTANASASLKIVGESYPFQPGGAYYYLQDNHNSIVGIRQYAIAKGASTLCVPLDHELSASQEAMTALLQDEKLAGAKNKLFGYPAQSNATGVKHDLGFIKIAKAAGWDVMLDAAAFVPTNKLDLGGNDLDALPDYVSLSFYKMFGYPSGIGCLLIKIKPLISDESPFAKLWYNKPFFAGGNVSHVASDSTNLCTADGDCEAAYEGHVNYALHKNYQCFEDGTPNYQGIPAVQAGLKFLAERNGSEGNGVSKHIAVLMNWMVTKLKQLRYKGTDQRIGIICGEEHLTGFGSSILIKCYKKSGKQFWAGTLEDELHEFNESTDHKLSIRIGTFCNPGVDKTCSGHDVAYLQQKMTRAKPNLVFEYQFPSRNIQRPRQEPVDMQNSNECYPGGIRVSLGYASSFHDVYVFMQFLTGLMSKYE